MSWFPFRTQDTAPIFARAAQTAQEGTLPLPGHLKGTMSSLEAFGNTPAACRGREVLDRVGDKWSLYVVNLLSGGSKRFTELKRDIDGISQRMLTVTLRGLERDGIVSRTMYPVMPPHVDYALTPLGRGLIDAVAALVTWAEDHLGEIDAARAAYDLREEKAKELRSTG
jgi:DNA-binding HxlR family transcriptional regulator